MSSAQASSALEPYAWVKVPPLGVVALLANVGVDLLAHSPPAIYRTFQSEALDALDHHVERYPAHHLGVDEVLPLSARLPDPVVGLLPGFFQVLGEPPLQLPAPLRRDDPGGTRHVRSRQYLAVDVELELAGGVVADAHRRSAHVARKPGQFILRQPTNAVYGVHDLRVGRVAGHGPEDPPSPGARLLHKAGAQ